ncbi:hypothetical protein CTA1_3042 [Colletotrichum tanaceti]|uniref:Uncharacterized protein n=1 Tax=Colletotrichum tanaceti TaxID=1306861 RepID=A0A4U6XQ29_9PEZI|nr:hypothetical protein CTA1_3042 [Colletotrichum tanaceti]
MVFVRMAELAGGKDTRESSSRLAQVQVQTQAQAQAQVQVQAQPPEDTYPASLASAAGLDDIGSAFDGPLTWPGSAENQLASEYFMAPSQFDMSGELSWFLSGYMDPDPASV